MASIKSVGFAAPQFMPGDGCGIVLTDYATISANPSVSDTVDFKIPAGMEVSSIEIDATDMDTNASPTLAYSAGYAPIQSDTVYTANATYFAAASAIVVGKTGGRVSLNFKPLKFEEDVILRLTCNAVSATFAAGEIRAVIHGAARGVK